jgi:hypothetical protein
MDEPRDPHACKLLTKLIMTGKLIREQPTRVIAADDTWSELQLVKETIEAAQRDAQPIRDTGQQVSQACHRGDNRYMSRFELTFEVVHDDEHEEVLNGLATTTLRLLEDDDVDVVSSSGDWVPIGPDARDACKAEPTGEI